MSTQIDTDGWWTIRELDNSDLDRILDFLERDPLLNVYLIARYTEEGFGTGGQSIEIRYRGETVCVALATSNVALAADTTTPESILEDAMALLASRIIERAVPVRAIIAPRIPVELLWKSLRVWFQPPTVVRLNQPVYALDAPASRFSDLEFVRYSTTADLDALVPACAAMHREEVGIDPVERDAKGYARRVRELVEDHRSFIGTMDGRIVFKCEISAETETAVQLMGVWTAPAYRRQGLARKGMREICGHLRRRGKIVTLFVNDFNIGAIALYEELGFRPVGAFRALIW